MLTLLIFNQNMHFYMLVTDVNIHTIFFNKTELAAFYNYGHKVYYIILKLSTWMTINYVYLKCFAAMQCTFIHI